MWWWSGSPNFGDRLGPWLVRRLTGKDVFFCEDGRSRLLACGTVAHKAAPGDRLWGCGAANEFWEISGGLRPLLLRGPLTRLLMLARCPVGDPALLLGSYYKKCDGGQDGYVPHRSDAMVEGGIDVCLPVEDFMERLRRCRRVFSASLAALAAADALGIPCQQVYWRGAKERDCSGAGDFRFRDYYAGTGRKYRPPVPWGEGDCYYWEPPKFCPEEMVAALKVPEPIRLL